MSSLPFVFQILSFVQLGRLEDAVRILEDMAKDHYLEGILMLFSETVSYSVCV